VAASSADVTICQHSGVTILNLAGEWSDDMQQRMRDVLLALARSAHLEVVLNISKTLLIPVSDPLWWKMLELNLQCLTMHHASVNIVGTDLQLQMASRNWLVRSLRWSSSEEEAVCRIRGVMQGSNGIKSRAWFAEPHAEFSSRSAG
jgi:hypothetical protein